MTLPALVASLGADCTVHGFRSSFRDWASEQSGYPDQLIEMCLAHSVGTAVEKAYKRTDLIEKRRQLMAQWERFVASPGRHRGAAVTPIKAS